MKNWIIKSNHWYDNLKEPYRFLLFFFGLALPISIGMVLINHGIYWFAPLIIVLALIWRMIGLNSYNNKNK